MSRPDDYNSRILLFVDGHRLNDTVYDSILVGMEGVIDVDAIDRVEIIRGPSSSVYGSNALFGVINIITRRGRELKGAELSAEVGTRDTYKGRASYGQRYPNGLGMFLSGSYFRSGGARHLYYPEFDNPSTNNGVSSNNDGERAYDFLGTFSFGDFTLLGAWSSRNKHIPTGSCEVIFNLLRTAAAAANPYDVAIVDRHMPDVDGVALVRTIKTEPANAPVRVIMLTSVGREESLSEAREAGIEAHLTKPTRQAHLHSCLASVLTRPARPSPVLDPAPAAPAEVLAGFRVLVAEDNPVNQQVATGMLEALGCRVDLADNGREALALAQRTRYDLIFMDCQMPDMDGFAATRAIRDHVPAGACVPIVALTAHALPEDRQRCLAAGMDDYLAKPFSLDAIRAVLRRWGSAPMEAPAAGSGHDGQATAEAAVTGHTEATPTASPPDTLDQGALERLRELSRPGGPDMVARITHAYLDTAPELMDTLGVAVHQGDSEAARRAAHSLKSSSANVGAMRLAALCAEMEARARGGDMGQAEAALPAVRDAFQEACAALGALREPGALPTTG